MNPIEEILHHYGVFIIDGALATELERRGCDLKDPLWSAKILLEQPDLIRQVHYDYFVAGADCAITASYQATVEGFMRRGLSREAALELIQRSVELAKQARDQFWSVEAHRHGRPRPLIAASVGPYGAFLADGSEYRGQYGLSKAQLMDFHRPRMAALLAARPDLLACETIPSRLEAEALVELLGEFPQAQAWISFSCRDEAHIWEGDLLSDCVRAVEASPQVVAVGINCTSPRFVPALILAARQATKKPVLVYPNSGENYDPQKGDWDGQPACVSFGEQARQWYDAGAQLLGGCCRTTPEDIRTIAAWARRMPAGDIV
jgi:homocysteine S-methyltransferase